MFRFKVIFRYANPSQNIESNNFYFFLVAKYSFSLLHKRKSKLTIFRIVKYTYTLTT